VTTQKVPKIRLCGPGWLAITAWLEHATYGLGNRFQFNNINSLGSSCCRCVAFAGPRHT
jgi:hypothetical protein